MINMGYDVTRGWFDSLLFLSAEASTRCAFFSRFCKCLDAEKFFFQLAGESCRIELNVKVSGESS